MIFKTIIIAHKSLFVFFKVLKTCIVRQFSCLQQKSQNYILLHVYGNMSLSNGKNHHVSVQNILCMKNVDKYVNIKYNKRTNFDRLAEKIHGKD